MQYPGLVYYHSKVEDVQAYHDIFPPTKVLLSSFFWPYACHDLRSNAFFGSNRAQPKYYFA